MERPFLECDGSYQKIKVKVVLHMWRKFGAFVTCVHISFKFGFKQPN